MSDSVKFSQKKFGWFKRTVVLIWDRLSSGEKTIKWSSIHNLCSPRRKPTIWRGGGGKGACLGIHLPPLGPGAGGGAISDSDEPPPLSLSGFTPVQPPRRASHTLATSSGRERGEGAGSDLDQPPPPPPSPLPWTVLDREGHGAGLEAREEGHGGIGAEVAPNDRQHRRGVEGATCWLSVHYETLEAIHSIDVQNKKGRLEITICSSTRICSKPVVGNI